MLVAAAVAVAGCGAARTPAGGSDGRDQAATAADDAGAASTTAAAAELGAARDAALARAAVLAHVKALANMPRMLPSVYRSAEDLLGNVRFARGDARPRPLTRAVVVGRVVAVAPGVGIVPTGRNKRGGDGTVVPFDSKRAWWRTVHVTVGVDEAITGDLRKGATAQVGIAVGDARLDFAQIRLGLLSLGRAAWFLARGRSPVFAYRPSLQHAFDNGRLIARVRSDGRLAFPLLDPGPGAHALRGATLAGLRAAAAKPPRTIRLRRWGGVWVR